MNELITGIALANDIKPDSWLQEERFEWFRKGYEYAASHTRSIPALAKVSPEELYFAVTQIIHGAKQAGFEVK